MTNQLKPGRPFGSFTRIHPARKDGKCTKAYSAWQAMIQRCTNPNAGNYKNYGARGIAVCDRWTNGVAWSEEHQRKLTGYDCFVLDLGVPLPGYWLERVNNDAGYSPDNCKWATPLEQAHNRGPAGPKPNPDSLRQKAKAAGLAYHVVYQRVKLHGWSEADALSTPCLGRKPVGGWPKRDKL